MNKTFTAMKAEAAATSSPVELFKIAQASNEKYLRNVAKAQFIDCMHGRAAEALHLFQNVLPGWAKMNREIQEMFAASVAGKSAQEIVEIIEAAR